LASVLAGLGVACDDKGDLPPEVLRARQQAQQQAAMPATRTAPTTQELLNGPKKTLRLANFPLSLEVPKSWNLGSMGNGEIITAGGPANSGEITIQLVQQGQQVLANGLELTYQEMKKEAQSKPHAINRVELRPLGPGKVLEQRVISAPFVNGKPPAEVWGDVETGLKDANGLPTTTRGIVNPLMIKWTFTVFLPSSEGKYSVRALTFMGLRLAEYEQDREFLEQLMKSLKYEE
jgi:hypothetical protein